MNASEQLPKGYRTLTSAEIELVNEIKDFFAKTDDLIQKITDLNGDLARQGLYIAPGEPTRWVSIGRTHAQEASMALVRAVTKPSGF